MAHANDDPVPAPATKPQALLDYNAACAIQGIADTANALALEYTNGFNTLPRNRRKAELWEDLLSALNSYSTIVGPAVSARIHRQHCGHVVSTDEAGR
jgi:hypothetical protein